MQQRISHKLTAHHFRHNRKGGTIIGVCSCGYRHGIFRKMRRTQLTRGIVCFFRGGHRWGEEDTWEVGPAGFRDGEGEASGRFKQCDFCYKIEDTHL